MKHNTRKLIEIRIQDGDKIQIPLPSYGYGATRRSRFAFGRITTAQARANTAERNKDKIEHDKYSEPEEDTFHNTEHTQEEEKTFFETKKNQTKMSVHELRH